MKRRSMRDRSTYGRTRATIVVLCSFLPLFLVMGQDSYLDRQQFLEHSSYGYREQRAFVQSAASNWFDVIYYGLSLDVRTATTFLQGTVTITGTCKSDTVGPLILDLSNRMQVDSVKLNGFPASFTHASGSLSITLDRLYHAGEFLTVEITYGGLPVPNGFGSFVFSSHSGTPWVWSLSEPYGARDWWPCKDDPVDKADSADIIVTCESAYTVGSQGILVSAVDLGNGKTTFHWRERYPIATYLISIAVTNYSQFSNWYRYAATDSMEILNYVLPEHASTAHSALPRTVDMLAIYSDLFGLYPFIREKYGHSEFGSGGAMEHQTMTSTTTFAEDVISHELAHQWFGDMITCRTWTDLWLNEGFAQYCAGLYRERKYGNASYWNYMNAQLGVAVGAQGIIGVADTSSVAGLFNHARMYAKGASVLHMLRHVVGDSVFFRCMKTYANQPALMYSTARISDFRTVCETVSGKNLGFFFEEWIYGERYPEYFYAWFALPSTSGATVTIDIDQTIRATRPSFFTMPVDIRLKASKWDTTVTVLNDSSRQRFTINTPEMPTTVELDAEGWILKQAFLTSGQPLAEYSLYQNFPNPFNPRTSIRYGLPVRSFVTIEIFDMLGRHITTLVSEDQLAGTHGAVWDASTVTSGVYFCRLTARSAALSGNGEGDFVKTMKMVVVR
ncbi:MAG: M1 family aminopeptidase [Bacteroidota bacterium]